MNTSSNPCRISRLLAVGLILSLVGFAVVALLPTEAPRPSVIGHADDDAREDAARLTTSRTTLPDRAPVASERHAGVYHARVGSRFVFDLDQTAEFELSAAHDGAARSTGNHRMHAHGRLELTVAARRPDEILVVVRLLDMTLESPTARGASARGAEIAAACEAPVLVKMAEDGRLLGFAFAEQHDFEARTMLRGLLGSLAFVVPLDAAGHWEVEATNQGGTFLANYQLLPRDSDGGIALRRTKTRYLTMVGFDDGVGEHEIGGHSSAWMDDQLGWLSRAEINESFALVLPHGSGSTRSHVKITLALTKSDWVANVCEGDPWSRPFGPVSGAAEEDAAIATLTANWRRRLEGVTLQSLLAELQALLETTRSSGPETFKVLTRLAWLLTLDAKVTAELRDLILANRVSSKLAMLCLSALGEAGTPTAQAALVAVLDNSALPSDIRNSAADGMFGLEKPGGEVFDALANQVGDMTALDDIRGSCLLAFGVLAGRSGNPMGNGRTPMEHLLGMETQARHAGATAGWLDALGNSCDAQTFNRVVAHLEHANPGVRQSALEALRGHNGSRAASAIEHRAIHDHDINVRARAVQVLGMRRDGHAATTLARLADQDASPIIRRIAITEISRMDHHNAQALLAHSAQNDSDKSVRDLAQRLLGLR